MVKNFSFDYIFLFLIILLGMAFLPSRLLARDWYVNDDSLKGDSFSSEIGDFRNQGLEGSSPTTFNKAIKNLSAGDSFFLDVGKYQVDTDTIKTNRGLKFSIKNSAFSSSTNISLIPVLSSNYQLGTKVIRLRNNLAQIETNVQQTQYTAEDF